MHVTADARPRSWRARALDLVAHRPASLVLGSLIVSYVVASWLSPLLLAGYPSVDVYLVRPLAWSLTAGVAFLVWRGAGGVVSRAGLVGGAAAGIAHLGILGIGGLVAGFGRSPAAVSIGNLIPHLWFLLAVTAGAEFARPVLVRETGRLRGETQHALVTLLMALVAIPPAQILLLGDLDRAVAIVGGRWIPVVAASALATWMTLRDGLGPSFVYRMVLASYVWFLPILPNLSWQLQMVFGVAGVAVAAMVFGLGVPIPRAREATAGSAPSATTLVGAALLGLVLAAGAFGIRARTVTGISMEPAISRGDVVLVWEQHRASDIEVGDLVARQVGALPVVHRVVGMEEGEGGVLVVTQGDNVARPDQPVPLSAIDGKVVGRIPLIGYPALWLTGR